MKYLILISIVNLLFLGILQAGGSSYNIKITSLTETSKDRYTMVFDQIIPQKDKTNLTKRYTLRLRYNDYYYSKKSQRSYTLDQYRKAIQKLQKHAQAKEMFPLGAMGGVWGIPVNNKKDEFWVQTIAIVEEFDGSKVIYTMKE